MNQSHGTAITCVDRYKPALQDIGTPGGMYLSISLCRSIQRCAVIFPASGMKHSRDDLLGEVMRMLRLLSAQAKSK